MAHIIWLRFVGDIATVGLGALLILGCFLMREPSTRVLFVALLGAFWAGVSTDVAQMYGLVHDTLFGLVLQRAVIRSGFCVALLLYFGHFFWPLLRGKRQARPHEEG